MQYQFMVGNGNTKSGIYLNCRIFLFVVNFLEVIYNRLGSKDVRMAKIKSYINVVLFYFHDCSIVTKSDKLGGKAITEIFEFQ